MKITVIPTPYYAANCAVLVADGEPAALVVDPSAGVQDKIREVLVASSAHVGAILATHGHPGHASRVPLLLGLPRYHPDRHRGRSCSIIANQGWRYPLGFVVISPFDEAHHEPVDRYTKGMADDFIRHPFAFKRFILGLVNTLCQIAPPLHSA